MLVGFGAVLLLASFARAQQDMDPTPFDDTRSARSEEQTAPTKSAQHSEAANGMKANGCRPGRCPERRRRHTGSENYSTDRPRHRGDARSDDWDWHHRVIRTGV
jgi:hypothetical protein